MAVVVWKDFQNEVPLGESDEVVLDYWIKATAGEFNVAEPGLIARSELASQADQFYDNRPAIRGLVTRVAPALFSGKVFYASANWDYRFAIKTQDTLVTRSLETMSQSVRSGGIAANFRGLIGVTRDGVQGTSVPVPVPGFTLTGTVPASSLTTAYEMICESLVGKQNAASFRGRERGTVLLAGVTGGKTSGRLRGQLTFEFLVSRKAINLTIDGITVAEKGGWDYLWTYAIEFPDSTAGRVVRRIEQVNVERIIEFGDFSQLGIPIV